jgi:Tol biopolymer transport system component
VTNRIDLASYPYDSNRSAWRAPRRAGATIAIEYVVLLTLAGVFLWRAFLPAWKTLNTDFPDYYLAARLYRQGYPLEQIYDWTWVQRQKDHAGIQRPIVTFTLLTPFSLLPVLPFSSLPPLRAKRCWLLVNLALLAVTGYLLNCMSALGPRRVAILVFLAMVPLRTNFMFGQEYVLLLFLLTLAAWFYFRNRALASGVILAVASALKIYPGIFLIFFARKKQWRAALGLLAATSMFWLLSIALFGFETIRVYLMEVLPWPLRGEGQDPYNSTWNSFTALLHRLLIAEPELNPHPIIHFPAGYAILQPVCQGLIFVPFLWLLGSARAEPGREKLHWGGFVAMLLILSTNPASYDFNALILAAVLAVSYLMQAGRRKEAGALVILYALVCFPTYRWAPSSAAGWQTILTFPRLWAMTGLWICIMVVSARSAPRRVIPWLKSRDAAVFSSLWLLLVALGATTNLLQLRGEFKSYANRLQPAPESLLATEPATAGDKVLFTAMTDEGYDTADLAGDSLTHLAFGSDSFHPSTAPGSASAWVEVASTQSRIVRFSLASSIATTPADVVVEAENAEKPSISLDGKWLAFIRESKGRGVLWVKELYSAGTGSGSDRTERPLTSAGLDVLDVAFDAADHIIFSARRGGEPALFSTGAGLGVVIPQSPPRPRRFPAASPDGRWLAFSQREGGNWQLWVRDLKTGGERRLTDSGCNSIAPAWYADSRHLIYATDCARGYGLTALCRIQAIP